MNENEFGTKFVWMKSSTPVISGYIIRERYKNLHTQIHLFLNKKQHFNDEKLWMMTF
jgi:hypothetical protein